MIIAVLALMAVSGFVQEPVDFQLGLKKGDKFTYVVTQYATLPILIEAKAEFVLTVTGTSQKDVTVHNSLIDYDKTMQSIQPGYSKITRKGKVTSAGSIGIGIYLRTFLLPDKPLEVGEEFKVIFPLGDQKLQMKGKFTGLEGKNNELAVLEMRGIVAESEEMKMIVTLKTKYDRIRNIVVSTVFDIFTEVGNRFRSTSSITLKQDILSG